MKRDGRGQVCRARKRWLGARKRFARRYREKAVVTAVSQERTSGNIIFMMFHIFRRRRRSLLGHHYGFRISVQVMAGALLPFIVKRAIMQPFLSAAYYLFSAQVNYYRTARFRPGERFSPPASVCKSRIAGSSQRRHDRRRRHDSWPACCFFSLQKHVRITTPSSRIQKAHLPR